MGYYTQNLFGFAFSPLRLEQACASCPPARRRRLREPACRQLPGGGYIRGLLIRFKLTAEIMVSPQILVIHAAVDGQSWVKKARCYYQSPPSGRGVENIPQGIFKGGEREDKRFLRAISL